MTVVGGCPVCGYDGQSVLVETNCQNPDDPEDNLRFRVCSNCDYGINEHTEGECDCADVSPPR